MHGCVCVIFFMVGPLGVHALGKFSKGYYEGGEQRILQKKVKLSQSFEQITKLLSSAKSRSNDYHVGTLVQLAFCSMTILGGMFGQKFVYAYQYISISKPCFHPVN